MTSVANTVAMTTLAVHTLQPLIFYSTYYGTVLAGTYGTYGTSKSMSQRYVK